MGPDKPIIQPIINSLLIPSSNSQLAPSSQAIRGVEEIFSERAGEKPKQENSSAKQIFVFSLYHPALSDTSYQIRPPSTLPWANEA